MARPTTPPVPTASFWRPRGCGWSLMPKANVWASPGSPRTSNKPSGRRCPGRPLSPAPSQDGPTGPYASRSAQTPLNAFRGNPTPVRPARAMTSTPSAWATRLTANRQLLDDWTGSSCATTCWPEPSVTPARRTASFGANTAHSKRMTPTEFPGSLLLRASDSPSNATGKATAI